MNSLPTQPFGGLRILGNYLYYQAATRRYHMMTRRMAILNSLAPSKYPPAKPGALVLEPLKAAYPCRTSQASLPLCGMLHAS
jgi:hypothetical protein